MSTGQVVDTRTGNQLAPHQASGSRVDVVMVNKTYQRQADRPLPALEDVSFAVEPGEFISVVGASGCGKSTLLRIIGGLSHATTGEVRLNGTAVDGPRRDIGFVFQSPELLPWRDVLSNAMIGAEVLGLDRQASKRRALELIQLVGLGGFEKSRPMELSGGMQQRNAIVRALLHEPNLLLMDEPFGALDALTREQMGVELLRIWATSEPSVIFVTHSVSEALYLSDRVVVMSTRPGRVQTIIDVGVPRPRDLSMLSDPEIGRKATHIRSLLGAGHGAGLTE
jgi:NitT/TauT family transport system ATP-binding protein